ncbi:MAG: phenylalanine--tRNA ligase subunit alpha [Candidatus Margulisbacteria bacterium]|nr:phenylalanine--tRNA ligase subunit alpha [Candidatus Margulisiibacteriota bacterium]
MDQLNTIDHDLNETMTTLATIEEIVQAKESVFGKKGSLTQIMKQFRDASTEDRPLLGQKVNQIKAKYLNAFDHQIRRLEKQQLDEQLMSESVDIFLPGTRPLMGGLHPIRQAEKDLISACESLGFSMVKGPIIEDTFHNFEALNIPDTHPSRDMHDTFYLNNHHVLRTHTSSVQIRHMLKTPPPLKMLSSGPVFRCDSDRTHSPMFHQMEGLYVNHKVTLPELKYTLDALLKTFFEDDHLIRFRSSYFPFTEPSFEVDIQFKKTGEWMEVLGAGMVHRNVFRSVNYNPDDVSGFAFGLGIDRLAMLKYGIEDIRAFYENDTRFLRQGAPC